MQKWAHFTTWPNYIHQFHSIQTLKLSKNGPGQLLDWKQLAKSLHCWNGLGYKQFEESSGQCQIRPHWGLIAQAPIPG